MNEIMTKCAHCSDDINTEDDIFYGSETNGNTYCETCHHADMNEGSVVMLTGPDYERTPEGPYRIIVGDWFVEDLWGESTSDLLVNRVYKSTDAWRGYYETSIYDWTEVLSGWTTGGGGDPIADRKQAFNEWAESLFDGKNVPPVNIALITDPTSNVFSTAIGVFVPDEQVETFEQWINGELDNLRYALS
jgi:hypothetical protein